MLFEEYSQCADALQQRPGRRRHHGQRDPARASSSESDGDFKLVGEQFTEEPYGIGITEGRRRVLRVHQRDARRTTRTPTSRPGRPPPARSRAPRRPSCPSRTSAPDLTTALTARPRPTRPARGASRTEHLSEEDCVDAVTDNLDLYWSGFLQIPRHLPLGDGRLARPRARSSPPAGCRRCRRCGRSARPGSTTFRNTPLTLVLFFFAFGLPEIGINRSLLLLRGLGADPLHVGVRVRGRAVRHQLRPGRAGGGSAVDRARRSASRCGRRAAAGAAHRRAAAGQRDHRDVQELGGRRRVRRRRRPVQRRRRP